MSPEAQRIAIAEACGWKKAEPPNTPVWWKNGEWVSNVYGLPDYQNDLNAMHEAEKILRDGRLGAYQDRLYDIAGDFDTVATAAQRAEAFLRTLNLWHTTP